jgi:hypothetical protein
MTDKDYGYPVTYDFSTNTSPRHASEIVRMVRSSVASPHDLAVELSRHWAGQPIKRIEVVDEIETV